MPTPQVRCHCFPPPSKQPSCPHHCLLLHCRAPPCNPQLYAVSSSCCQHFKASTLLHAGETARLTTPAMHHSSLVAARPGVAPFSRASSRQRWTVTIGALMLFVACAALVATLGAPQRPTLAADLGPSMSERSNLRPAVRFSSLQGDPLDSVLKKVSARVAAARRRAARSRPPIRH